MPGLEGRVLCGRYRVDEYIGGGGMADVYKAWDLRRSCYLAIKLMRQSLSESEELGVRFKREADILSRLQHPNIVRLYGFEQDDEDGLAFIVMDYVDGPTLASKLKIARGPLPIAEVVQTMEDVAAALTYAHNQKIYHRDIKPSNIIIARDGRAVLSDFGIARLSDALTMTYQGIGTPAYMSPEQCEGKEAGAPSDIYSLGVVLYECVTGRRPFLGDFGRGEAPTTANIIKEHLELPPPAPTDVNPSLRPAVEAVIVKALAKDPQYRYQSAAELGRELRVAAGGAVLPALRVSTTPGGARIFIDGVLQGVTPLEVPRLAEGSHEIRVSARGFQDHSEVIQTPEQRTLEVRLQSETPAVAERQPAPEAAASAGGAVPPMDRVGLIDRWRGWWRRPWFKAVLGLAGAGMVIGTLAILFVLASGDGEDGVPPTVAQTSSPNTTPSATPSRTPTPTPSPTATAAPTPTPPPSPQGGKSVEFSVYEGPEAINAETGVAISTEPAADVGEGKGFLTILFKYSDGNLAKGVDAKVYRQEQDANGDPILVGSARGFSRLDDKSLRAELAPGTYGISLEGPRGYWGPWRYGYDVAAGQNTSVVFVVSRLSIVVRDADGELLKPKVNVYFQGSDVNEQPIRGNEVTQQTISDLGKAIFDLLPGIYWIELGNIQGHDWGRADNLIKPATRTDITVTLGRIVHTSEQRDCLDVYGQQQGSSGEMVLTDTRYANACVDTNFGAVWIDLTPGTYAVKIGESVTYDVEVVAGQVTELEQSQPDVQ